MIEREQHTPLKDVMLVQQDNLEAVDTIPDPESIHPKLLEEWYNTANQIADYGKRFSGLAFNQIPESITRQLGFCETVPKHVVYLYPSTLLLNPMIVNASDTMQLSAESCGSIRNNQYLYFIHRPMDLTIQAHVWRRFTKQRLQPQLLHLHQENAIVIEHEIQHLEGNTSLDYPERFLDLDDEAAHIRIQRKFGENFFHRMSRVYKGVISYNYGVQQFETTELPPQHTPLGW